MTSAAFAAQHARGAVAVAAVWLLGDFAAQFYGAHASAAAERLRRLRAEQQSAEVVARAPGPRTRPTAAQMYALLDKERLAQAAAFGGALAYPLSLLVMSSPASRAVLRTRGRLVGGGVFVPTRAMLAKTKAIVVCALCMRALALQQLVLTPLLAWSYINAMTAARGGFAEARALSAAHDDSSSSSSSAAGDVAVQRASSSSSALGDVLALEGYMVTRMLPYMIAYSWAAYTPAYAAAWTLARGGGALSWLLPAAAMVPWTAYLSRMQEQQLL